MGVDLNKEFQKLVTDERFIEWVKNPTPESDKYWEKFQIDHPTLKNEFSSAKYIVKRLQKENKKIEEEQIREFWSDIQLKISTPRRKVRTIRMKKWMAAASIVLLLGIGSLVWFLIGKNNMGIDYQSIAKTVPQGNEVQLILSDSSRKLIQSKDPSIFYNQKGEILIDSISLQQSFKEEEKVPEEIYNQLVVPYGKRSSLILSDGSTVYLNSGSRVIYPVAFTKKKREIYIEGEAYLKVSHNTQWPFYVATDHLKVKVLGTEFNIKSYPEEKHSSVVLVTGSVQVLVKSEKIAMKESELLTLNNTSGKTSRKKTDVLEYISWKDGWLYCNNEEIESIAVKLSRYYDVKIRCKDLNTEKLTISGKLDLKSECTQVLDAICFTAPVKYAESNGSITISIK